MTSKEARKPNIILIVIDALRARSLGCYGKEGGQSPNIDKAAEAGVLFEDVYSAWNTTDQSLTSILTGRYPRTHGITHHGDKVKPEDREIFDSIGVKTLTEHLKEQNYHTMAVDWMARWFTRGFDYYGYEKERSLPGKLVHYLFKLPYIHVKYMLSNISLLRLYSKKRKFSLRSALEGLSGVLKTFRFTFELARIQDAGFVTDLGMDLIRKSQENPFFLFLHYWDTHTPYNGPRGFRPERKNKSSDLKEHLIDIYEGAVSYADHHIGRLMDFLKKEGRLDNTWIIITSDHGESLTEHEIYFDHHGLYDVTTHCPLIFHFPVGFSKPRRIKGFVQHIDLVPTICEWMNISCSTTGFDGVSLLPSIQEGSVRFRNSVFMEESYVQRKIALREEKYKYIFAPDGKGWCHYCEKVHKGVEELYDLEKDPGEAVNLMARNPETAARMRRELDEIICELNSKRQREFISGKIAGLKKVQPQAILREGTYVAMSEKKDETQKLTSMQIQLPESLVKSLEEMAENTEFAGKEELVSFLVQEVFKVQAVSESPAEDKKIKRKLRSLGYMD